MAKKNYVFPRSIVYGMMDLAEALPEEFWASREATRRDVAKIVAEGRARRSDDED